MDEAVRFFFRAHLQAMPLYESFASRLLTELPATRIKVQSSQISYYYRHLLACVSLLKVRRKEMLPPAYIVVTFGLPQRVLSARIDASIEPYPGRWTHHVLISDPAEIDDELMEWLHQAAVFSAQKR